MVRLILIETSTALCSVALSENGRVVAYRQSSEPKAHASLTAVFVDEVLKEAGVRLSDCDGVCVSKGPGSYTGLRVGVSTAKGLCFGAGVPLLAVGTLDTLVAQAGEDNASSDLQSDVKIMEYKYIVPMIDARRMEVYTALFRPDTKGVRLSAANAAETKTVSQITPTEAKIIDGASFAEQLSEGPVLFVGDGAQKCRPVITHPNAHFLQCYPKASSMVVPAEAACNEKRFEDVAYFEPFYLKNFVATVSKKKLI